MICVWELGGKGERERYAGIVVVISWMIVRVTFGYYFHQMWASDWTWFAFCSGNID